MTQFPPYSPVTPEEAGELAVQMVSVACELACLVRDADRAAIGQFLGRLSPAEMQALAVVQAAMIPDDRPVRDLLAWVTWDEHGRALPGTSGHPSVPQLALEWQQEPGAATITARLEPCGTYAAYSRHKTRSEDPDEPCRTAARAYWLGRKRARDARKERTRAA